MSFEPIPRRGGEPTEPASGEQSSIMAAAAGADPRDEAPWGMAGAVLVPFLSFAFQLFFAALFGVIALVSLRLLDPSLAEDADRLSRMVILVTILPVALAWAVATMGLIYASVSVICRRPFLASLRIRPPGRATPLFVLVGGAAAMISVTLAGLYPPEEPDQPGGVLAELVRSGPLGLAIWLILAVMIAPVIEEVLFRGYAYLGARRRLGRLGAGAAVTILFVAMHLPEAGSYWPALAGIAAVAALLVLVMEFTGNLTHCIACHLGYNGALALLFLMRAMAQ